jgi:drug/metabolite transporter (DMT)-like permease
MDIIGELAAVASALAFTVTAVMFTECGRRYGAVLANRASLPIGLLCLLLIYSLTTGQLFPLHVEPERWLWLGISGLLGFWASFLLIVRSYVLIGPRLTLLIMSLSPILGAIMAWVFLDEVLNASAIIGIALTLGGIIMVVSEGNRNGKNTDAKDFKLGVLLALTASGVQATSFIFSKIGLAGNFDPVAALYMRVMVASLGIWTVAVFQGEVKSTVRSLRAYPVAFRQLTIGSIGGPVMGALLFLVSLQHAPVGVASTLTNLTPIFLIPVGYVVFKERITRRAVFGTMVAVFGTVVLFL